MAAKSTKSTSTLLFKKRNKRKLRRHTKTLTYNKGSKNYTKKYRGQGGRR
jgi:hypothetical protein